VRYVHTELKDRFFPRPSNAEVNQGRYCRLLKLSADATERFGGQARSISVREAQTNNVSVLFIDCRTVEEMSVSVVPGSVPAAQLTEADMASPRLVVAYCCIGLQSAAWCQAQADGLWGYKVRFLAGGLASWMHHRGELVKPATKQRVQEVHCWVRELAQFFPSDGSGGAVRWSSSRQTAPHGMLQHATDLRLARLSKLAWEVRLRFWPDVFCIEAPELLSRIRAGAMHRHLLVDCRTEEERGVSTIDAPGCVIVPGKDVEARAEEYFRGFDVVITFCTVGGRSGIYNNQLFNQIAGSSPLGGDPGHLRRRMLNVAGGIAAWLHHGGGLVDPSGQATRCVHPWVRAFMDLFPIEGLELVVDEAQPVPQDAVSLIAVKAACGERDGDCSKCGACCRPRPSVTA